MTDNRLRFTGFQFAVWVALLVITVGLITACVVGRPANTSFSQGVTNTVFGLLGFAVLILVLPRLTSLSFEGLGVKGQVDLDTAKDATKEALKAAEPTAVAQAAEPTPATTAASADPRTSIELSRRSLASALAELSYATKVPPTGDLKSTATALETSGAIDAQQREAIIKLADAIAAGKTAKHPDPELALEIDWATQLTTGGLLNNARAAAAASSATAANATPSAPQAGKSAPQAGKSAPQAGKSATPVIKMTGDRQARADTVAHLMAQGYGRDHAREVAESWHPDEPASPSEPVSQAHRVTANGRAKVPNKPAVKPAS